MSVVSFDSEELILVNDEDQPVGTMHKRDAHKGHGVLHRAFSQFIFTSDGRLLLQQRSAEKPLWGLFWSNTCCSHPRQGESMTLACERRLWEELGMRCELSYLYRFKYQADFGDRGAEHEFCWVYAGISDVRPQPNPTEIEAWRYVSADELEAEFAEQPERFTPWFKMEWEVLKRDYPSLMRGELPDKLGEVPDEAARAAQA